ncbi:MAG: APC family permease [Elusimicrobia bacterium]|nr:APC family permease [Elusimicrobiota bacterium]MBU2614596.1 APC family permease [Elusimicrobiota bacterium]
MVKKFKKILLGNSRDISDKQLFHKLSLIAFFAWVGLGADGLSSSCYGPEEAFRALGTHTNLGILIAIASAITVIIIGMSYSQIIELFPSGGGGYLVASRLLSPAAGMVSGCALLIDYVLTIAVSVSSGASALFSFFPPGWYPFRVYFAALMILFLIILNLRGVKESVLFLTPIFVVFIATHLFVIIYAIMMHSFDIGTTVSTTVVDFKSTTASIGYLGVFFLLIRAYSMGAGTYTGIEAVSNGMSVLREPKVKTAKRTMNYMMISLSLTVMGLMTAYVLYKVVHVPGKTLNAVLFENIIAGWNVNVGKTFLLTIIVSETALLFVAAQTGFLGGPRVLANMALDRWFPTRFSMLSDRFVTQNGILLMGGAALLMLIVSRGSIAFLIILYSINVFITFFLSQLGMVRHWWQVRAEYDKWKKKLLINGIGLLLTSFILVSMIIIKFGEGGWITLFITLALVLLAIAIRRHYINTLKLLKRLNDLVQVASISPSEKSSEPKKTIEFNPKEKTAVLFVNGFNGLGLHTLFNVFRLFGAIYKNYVFVYVGTIDAGNFNSREQIDKFKENIKEEIDKYVQFVKKNGYYSEAVTVIGTDVVNESDGIASQVLERFPNSVFFGGQLVFPKETFFSKLLHNYTVFAIQRILYSKGIPFIILPIRVY